jgi:haloacetate dehalogenase
MFDGFSQEGIESNETTINVVHGGDGPAVLLLHGYPQTHICWHAVAPRLAEHFTVVCTDLRGYGDSDKPASDVTHYPYSKRAMARDQVEVMRALGFDEFAVVGHDRGARVAHRMALDFPNYVSRLALLDIVPTATAFANVDRQLAASDYHWFFLTQPDELPERLIGAASEFYLRWTLDHWCGTPGALAEAAVDEYLRCFDQSVIHSTCEDYRAAATIDLEHDDADKDRKITCPLLLLWSAGGTGASFDVLGAWRDRASENLRGRALDCGHFLAEERPQEVVDELMAFLSDS